MADVKWSSFSIVSPTPAGTTVGLQGGTNVQYQNQLSGFPTTVVTGSSQAMSPNNRYISNNGSVVTLTLPATATIGDVILIRGEGAGGWSVAQNSGQTIHFGVDNTTTGISGSLSSTQRFDCIQLECLATNTDFIVCNVQGNITVV